MENIKKINFLQILILTIPFSIALGNLVTNLNILLFIIFGFYRYQLKIFTVEKNLFNISMFSFFFFLIFTSFINFTNFPSIFSFEIYNPEHIIKSLLFLRYFLFYLVLNKLIESGEFNFKYLFFTCAFISTFLGIDLIIQNIFGVDLFGYELMHGGRGAGFFGDELIAGGFLQKFSLFCIFLFPFFNSEKIKNNKIIYFSLTSIFFLFSIILSYNRTPLVLFIISLVVFILLDKSFRKFLILIFASLIIIFTLSFNFSTKFSGQFKTYLISINEIYKTVVLDNNENISLTRDYSTGKNVRRMLNSTYAELFKTSINLWSEKKIIGGGIKSFRVNCHKYFECSTHPHNYVLEILVDTGIVGFFLVSIFSLISLISFLKTYFKKNHLDNNENTKFKIIIIVPFLILLMEIFPIRSSGSFFSTNNAILIFMMLAFVQNSPSILKNIGKEE